MMESSSSLLNDVVEEIFLRLSVKSIIRLKSLSKQWSSNIESRSFSERHLKIAERSHVDHPKVMAISDETTFNVNGSRLDTDLCFRTICSESTSVMSVNLFNFPQGFHRLIHVSESCDGLFCIHSHKSKSIYVVNPATRWLRQLPPARFQILMHNFTTPYDLQSLNPYLQTYKKSFLDLAFVKATHDYKLVWLYNSDKYNSDAFSPNEGPTNCEVFDFRANAWRYLTCTPSYRIYNHQTPASANGSVYWFTERYNGEINVVVFNIHNETFRVLPKINPRIASSVPDHIDMCTLDNDLCIWRRELDTMIEDIWRLKSSEDTWEKIHTIDLFSCSSSPSNVLHSVSNWTMVAMCKNKQMLLRFRCGGKLIKYDPHKKSLRPVFLNTCLRYASYLQSLISHI